jgi:hypothetical protein
MSRPEAAQRVADVYARAQTKVRGALWLFVSLVQALFVF